MPTLECGHPPTPREPGSCATGTARIRDNPDAPWRTACYACAAEHQRAQAARDGQTTGYVSGDARRITTWSGETLLHVRRTWETREGFGRYTFRWEAVAPDGSRWYGRGPGPNMYTRAHRRKPRKPRLCST